MTDYIAKRFWDRYDLYDPLEETEEPIAQLPAGMMSGEQIVNWLSLNLGMDIAVEEGEGDPAPDDAHITGVLE